MASYEFADRTDMKELFNLQRSAFESEAEMIGSRDIPALKESYEHFCEDFDNWTVLIMRDVSGRITGAVRFRKTDDHIDIGRLMVAQEHRNKGIATGLMYAVEEVSEAGTFELFTSSKSYTNIKLYEKLGYRAFMEKPGPEDYSFIFMRKTVQR
jgi:ribosomal protein S18 acetylase RimI-like enzyme